jgi:chemotaxis protein MotB
MRTCEKIFIHILSVTICVAMLASCGINEDIYKRDMNQLKNQINDLESQTTSLDKEKNSCLLNLKALGQEKGNLSSDLQAALLKIEELKSIAERRKKVFDNLMASLKSMMDAGKIQVKIMRGMLVVQLSENILFPTGSSKLKPEGQDALAELTKILTPLENRKWQIAGHTDNVGSEIYNWKLSTERAISVVYFMIEQGMPPQRLSACGFGQFAPVAPNETDEGKALNRRIEVILMPNLEELQLDMEN